MSAQLGFGFAPTTSRTPSRDARPSDSEPGRGAYKARRDAGIARAREHAEADVPDWTETAAAYLRKFARDTAVGQPFMVEDASECSLGYVPEPDNGKAWGGAVQLAARRGWLRKAGYASARSSNGSPKCT